MYGVVFDLDGVLIDSHAQHKEAWLRLARERDLTLTDEQFDASFGMRNENCIPDIYGWAERDDPALIKELGDRKEEHYRDLLAEKPLTPLPGVLALLESLENAGIPISLGSSTSRDNISVCFATTPLGTYFGENYTGAEDVTRGKPAPDVFLEAARKIDRTAAQCVVIEDAHVGVDAATAAKMKVIAVTTTHERETFDTAKTSLVVASLAEISADTVIALLGK